MQVTLDPNPTESVPVDRHHNQRNVDMELNRRHLLKLGVVTMVAASLPGRQLQAQSAPESCAPPIPANHGLSNGGSCPYPIPWLDKNGNHNQSPAPNVELSNIFHFKGSWRGATASTVWGRTIKAIALRGETPLQTTAIWQANTGQDGKLAREYSPIPDLPCSRDRRSLRTSSTTFIRPFHLKGCIGSRLCHQTGSPSVRTEQRPRCR